MKKPAFFSGLLMLVVGALLALAAMFWLPHCGGEKPMRCIWMLHAVCGVGLVVAISGVLMQFAARGVAMGLSPRRCAFDVLDRRLPESAHALPHRDGADSRRLRRRARAYCAR